MRLLKTDNVVEFEFKQFYEQDLPPYAILSHTWSQNPEDEVLYLDVFCGTSSSKPRFKKVQATLSQAKADGYEYCWIDTCCIDKSSSAELSEAINSMYRWYQGASVCYVFLEDLSIETLHELPDESILIRVLQNCRWFRRGFTLQELLAPADVLFFCTCHETDRVQWFGSKSSLCSTISRITGIDKQILRGERPVESASVAQRMSWAAHRRTSRLEDEAYCLMGLFNVNMPMLWIGSCECADNGKAFVRLQEEIIKQSDDETIFAWKSNSDEVQDTEFHGLLADSPKRFADSGGFIRYEYEQPRAHELATSTWTMTNKGLSLRLPLVGSGARRAAVLRCHDPQIVGFIGVRLQKLETNQYARIECQYLDTMLKSGNPELLCVPQVFVPRSAPNIPARAALQFRKVLATKAKSWNTAYASDYVIQDAIFNGHDPPSWQAGAPQWIEVPEQLSSPPLLAAFFFRSSHYSSQFLLLIYVLLQHNRPDRLRFCAVEKPRNFKLGRSLSTCARDVLVPGCETNKSWMALDGKPIRGVSLNATSHDVPGGRFFEIDVAVYTSIFIAAQT